VHLLKHIVLASILKSRILDSSPNKRKNPLKDYFNKIAIRERLQPIAKNMIPNLILLVESSTNSLEITFPTFIFLKFLQNLKYRHMIIVQNIIGISTRIRIIN